MPVRHWVGFLLLLLVVILNPRAIVFAVLASLTGRIYFFVNSTISRPRPSGQLVEVSEHLAGNSFPSGHATFAATYAALLVLCVGGKYLRRRALLASAVAGALVVLVFSVARRVTGGHWPSDVLGGLLLAGGWMTTLLSLRLIGDPVVRWQGDPDGSVRDLQPTGVVGEGRDAELRVPPCLQDPGQSSNCGLEPFRQVACSSCIRPADFE